MSHHLHRVGPDELMAHEFTMLSRGARNVNTEGAAEKLKTFIDAALRWHPANMGLTECGNLFTADPEQFKAHTHDVRPVNVVFDDRAAFQGFLGELIERGWDLSVTVTGQLDQVVEISRALGLRPHSANVSLGVFGKTELLPREEILHFTTMCGHHQIAPQLVEATIADVAAGRLTARAGAEAMAKLCPCGAFNITRAEEQLARYVPAES